MPIQFRPVYRRNLLLVRLMGNTTARVLLDGIEAGHRSGYLRQGMDRLVLVDVGARLAELDLDALRRVQERDLLEEVRGGRAPAFRCAIAVASPLHRGIAHLYKALWDACGLSAVRIEVCETLPDAVAALGRPMSLLHRCVCSRRSFCATGKTVLPPCGVCAGERTSQITGIALPNRGGRHP